MTDVEKLLQREARLLDEGSYPEWLALYADECEYWVPASPGQTDAREQVSLFYEDRTLMETRVRRLRHSQAHSLVPPFRTSRLVGNIDAAPVPGVPLEMLVSSTFHLVEFRQAEQRVFAGRYKHRLRASEGGLKIVSKRVELINCDAAHEVIQGFL